jgi:LuxR family transcriptional regulator, maltose regulon positive regulatory protein
VNSPVLKTKLLIPPLQPRLVPRPRLSRQIDSAVQSGMRLILIAAPAGFGKTTVVSSWVHQNHRQSAWISLDESDNEPMLFWAYVIAALQTIRPDFGAAIDAKLDAPIPPAVGDILPELVNELVELSGPLTLVLDDYHVISNQEIHDSLAFLLNHQPPQFHLVIATRADPPLPIPRLRAQRALMELRSEDLRFTRQEARLLLNEIMELDLSTEDIRLLEKRTEGWGVGLLLAAQSMQGRKDKHEFISAFSGSHHYILEYLIEEVLDRQPGPLRDFLLRTSILDQLCGPLCEAVTGTRDGTETLARLYKDNLFIVPLDLDHIWYRYHHLFGDLLIDHLYKEFSKQAILELHCKASRWYEQDESLEKAVQYALTGQDYERAAQLIEREAGKVIARGQVKTLLQWLNALPVSVVNAHPQLLMRLGWSTFLSGKVAQASEIFKKAEQALAILPAGSERDLLQGQLFAMLATLSALTRDLPGAITQAEWALQKLPQEDVNYRARARRALGVSHMFLGELEKAIKHLDEAKSLALEGQNQFLASEILSQIATVRKHQGDLNKAFQTYRQILDFYDAPEDSPPACLGFIGMAEIALEWDDLLSAEKYLQTGIELAYKGNIGYPLQPAFLIQGLLRQAKGDRQGALEATAKGENLSQIGGGSLESILGLAGFQVRLNLQLGELDRAEQWARGELLPGSWSFEDLPPVLHEIQQSLLARVYLSRGEMEKVSEIYECLFEPARAGGRLARVIELSLFNALASESAGRNGQAFESFKECLELAEPAGYVRLFLEVGEPVCALLKQVAVSGNQAGYASRLLVALEGSRPADIREPTVAFSPQALVEPLTRRELQVLHLICEGCSNQQIAAQLSVSVNTIKKHTSNIYGKLGVRNRAQAVIRAQEIELI